MTDDMTVLETNFLLLTRIRFPLYLKTEIPPFWVKQKQVVICSHLLL